MYETKTQPKRREPFQFLCGTGTLRAKNTPDAVIREGRISVPLIGQCYINGVHGHPATSVSLEVKHAETRKVIGHLLIPVSRDHTVDATLVIGSGNDRETWKVVATLRRGESGPYRALRMPDVKIDAQQKREAFGNSKYAVA